MGGRLLLLFLLLMFSAASTVTAVEIIDYLPKAVEDVFSNTSEQLGKTSSPLGCLFNIIVNSK